MRASISSATPAWPRRIPDRSSRPTPRRRWSRSSRRRCRATRRRSTTPAPCSSYTKIIAPIDGRTGIRLVDEGNFVQAGDATGIVVITQIKPISVLFNLPQQQFSQVNKAFAKGPLAVDAVAHRQPHRGRSRHAAGDRQPGRSDHRHGPLKAEFPNADLQLWPGQFVNVRLLVETLKQVVVVPTAAVQRGPNGTFVYVVDAESKVAVRPVTVAHAGRHAGGDLRRPEGAGAAWSPPASRAFRTARACACRRAKARPPVRRRAPRRAAMPRRRTPAQARGRRRREHRRQAVAPASESTPATPSAKQ